MNSKEESKHKMYNAADGTLIKFNEVLKTLPNYSPTYEKFKAVLDVINVTAEAQMLAKTSGHTKQKKILKNNLWVLVLDNSKKIQAYAKFTGNTVLLDEITFSESTLKYSTEEELREYARNIYTRANENLTELAPYGITAETQQTLLAAIDSYVASIPKSRMLRVSGKDETRKLKQAFKDADAALSDMDTLIEIIRLSNVECYNQYQSARKIINLAKSSMSLKGMVVEAGTNTPLRNATITFTLKLNGTTASLNGNGSIVKKSAEKGGFYLKYLPEGIYTVTIQKTGYITKQQEIVINSGTLDKLVVELQKS